MVQLPNCFDYMITWQLTTPVLQPQKASFLVWAVPRSLAATQGIEFLSLPVGTKMFQFPTCSSY